MNKMCFKKVTLVGMMLVGLYSCESDDICVDKTVTPKVVVCAYDKDKPNERKKISKLIAYGEGQAKNEIIAMGDIDSLLLPLKMTSKETTFVMVKDAELDSLNRLKSGEETKLTIKYTPVQEFGNKGCGVKVTFKDIKAEKEAGWITNIKIMKTEFKDENYEILRIYF